MTPALASATQKATTLLEALPYIRAWRDRSLVVKIGGEALDDPGLSSLVADDIALLVLVGVRVVVVHGGGPQVSQAMEEAGLEPSFIDGLRVTDERAMEIVRRVLIGSINNDLVARLAGAGISPVGLSGADGNIFRASVAGGDRRPLGRVGEISSVDTSLVGSLLDGGYTPVIAPVSTDPRGLALNINADAVAGAIAATLGAEKLVYLTNVEGLYADLGDSGSLISEMKASDLEELARDLSSGMGPKARSILAALGAGVGKAHILDGRVPHALLLEVFTDEGIGTQVLP